MGSERIAKGSAATSRRGIPRDEIEDRATAVFIESLAGRYRDGAPMRVDAPLAEFLVTSGSVAPPRKRRARQRMAVVGLLASSIGLLGAFGALPAGAQSALARVSGVLGISLLAPVETAPGPPHDTPKGGGTTTPPPRPSTHGDDYASKRGSPTSGASEQGSGHTPPVPPSAGGDTTAIPPGQSSAPGHTPPSQSSAPGQTTPPGQDIAPGQTTPPGQDIAPGQTTPGHNSAPGQTTPAGQDSAPGQTSAPGGSSSKGREGQ
jgi:hypothetical protein